MKAVVDQLDDTYFTRYISQARSEPAKNLRWSTFRKKLTAKPVSYFHKTLNLDVWQVSDYASDVICSRFIQCLLKKYV